MITTIKLISGVGPSVCHTYFEFTCDQLKHFFVVVEALLTTKQKTLHSFCATVAITFLKQLR